MAIYAEVKSYAIGDDWGIVSRVIDYGAHVPEAAPPTYFIDIAGYTPQPVDGENWWYDVQGDVFTDTDPIYTKPPDPAPQSDALDLWFVRFTEEERAKTWAVCANDDPPGVTITLQQRYKIASFRDVTVSGLPFAIDDPEVVSVVNGLETAGVLAAGRAAQILAY
jgi:hypothetical protein